LKPVIAALRSGQRLLVEEHVFKFFPRLRRTEDAQQAPDRRSETNAQWSRTGHPWFIPRFADYPVDRFPYYTAGLSAP